MKKSRSAEIDPWSTIEGMLASGDIDGAEQFYNKELLPDAGMSDALGTHADPLIIGDATQEQTLQYLRAAAMDADRNDIADQISRMLGDKNR